MPAISLQYTKSIALFLKSATTKATASVLPVRQVYALMRSSINPGGIIDTGFLPGTVIL